MTFKHKLACRLALMRDRVVVGLAALLATAVMFACEKPVQVTGPNGSILAQLGVAPITVTLHQNQVVSFMAVALTTAGDTDVTPVAIAWSATGGTILDTSSSGGRHYGHYQAAASPGTYQVAAAVQPSGLADTATVTVIPVPVASVSVSPSSPSVLVGGTVSLVATTLDSAGGVLTGRAITWSSSSPAVATVSGSGVVTAVTPGSATITATSEGKSGTASVAVSSVPVASVTVAPASASLQVGQTAQLTATPKDASGNPLSGRVVTWSSSDTTIAKPSGTGLVTARAAGSATITATSEGQSGTAAVTVVFVPVASVTVSPASATLGIGQKVQLTATPKDASGNPLSGRVITWSSGNTTVATVSVSGLVTASAAGSATITATSEGQSGTSAVTAIVVPVASVTVSPASASVVIGGATQLTAVAKDSAGNTLAGRTMTWSSSNALIATVTSAGLVAGVAAGSATITATSEGKSGTASITVIVAPPPSACGNTGSGTCYYVDAALGNDANPGTSALPFRTLQKAAGLVNPGDGVLVNDGVYTGGSNVVSISRSGTAANWIVFQAVHRWGAVIDGQNNASANGISISGNYIKVAGFEVRWMSGSGIEAYAGNELVAVSHDVVIAGNNVHHIGRVCDDGTGGHVGIVAYASNLVIEQNMVHDVGRFGPGENPSCTPSSTNWQNHDHGIYHAVGDSVIVRNNIFYNNVHGWSYHRYSGGGASATGVYILNNTWATPNPNKAGQIIIAGKTNGLVIANNVFYQPNTVGINFDAADGGTWAGAVVENNLSTTGVATTGVSGVTLIGGIPNTDPTLLNPAGFDFHLLAGSPAIDAGFALPFLVTNDFDGVRRPRGAGWDIGAYEF
jgi:uncharacterized protein YjdB